MTNYHTKTNEWRKIIHRNHLGHFRFLPEQLGFDVYELNGTTIINCGLTTSMFNIAYGTPKTLVVPESIDAVKNAFGGKPFAWWFPSSDHNQQMTDTLLKEGLQIETTEHAMICHLEEYAHQANPSGLKILPVLDQTLMHDFIKVIEVYDANVNDFYQRVNAELLRRNEKLFVGYDDNKPVTIGILFCDQDNAGIFSLITNADSRGKGHGTSMMLFMLEFAKKIGCRTATLSASSDAGYRIYERLGFYKVGEFECFEYAGDA